LVSAEAAIVTVLFDTDRNPDLTEDEYGLFEWQVHLFADDWNAREDKLM
jgi:hypothetical protein